MTESENPYEILKPSDKTPQKPSKLRNLKLIDLLVCVSIIATFAAFFLPPTQRPYGSSQVLECKNNLKNIALAIHNYAAQNRGEFPPAYTVDSTGRPLHSWRTLILPYLDYRDLYDRIDLSKPWDDPANAEVFKTRVKTYHCPSADTADHTTTYLAIVTQDGCLHPLKSVRIDDITDGPGNTLMLIDIGSSQAIPWMSPQDADEQMVLDLGLNGPTPHPGGTNVAFADGGIGYFETKSLATERRAMISISGDDN